MQTAARLGRRPFWRDPASRAARWALAAYKNPLPHTQIICLVAGSRLMYVKWFARTVLRVASGVGKGPRPSVRQSIQEE